MDESKIRRFGWAIYLFILACSLILALIGIFIIKEGPYQSLSLNLAADLFVVSAIFFIIDQFFLWNPRDEQLKDLEARLQKVDKVLEKVENIVEKTSMQASPQHAYRELIKEYEASEKSVSIISWPNLLERLKDKNAKVYFETLLKRLKEQPNFVFRWLLWNQEHLDVLEGWTELNDSSVGSEFRFLFPPSSEGIPLLPCVLVDETIVNFGWGYLGRPEIDEVNIALKQPEAVKAFSEYFTYLWQKSISVKERGKLIDMNKLKEIRENLTTISDTKIQTTSEKAYHELMDAYESSKESINIISWRNLRVRASDRYKQNYFKILMKRLKSSPSVAFRRILWMQEHLEILEEWAESYNNIPDSEFRFFIPSPRDETPIIPCVIVDEKIVNFGWGYLGRSQMDEVNITLQQFKAVKAFSEYFSYLWVKSIPLKERGKTIEKEKIVEVRKAINEQSCH